MSVVATIVTSGTGQPIQKNGCSMPKPKASFDLEFGERVTTDCVNVDKLGPGKFSPQSKFGLRLRAEQGHKGRFF